jgi:hypothetical protein
MGNQYRRLPGAPQPDWLSGLSDRTFLGPLGEGGVLGQETSFVAGLERFEVPSPLGQLDLVDCQFD